MIIEDIKKELHFDEAIYVKNPYFYIRDYEDKGVIVFIKKERNQTVHFENLENVCFECPDIEDHPHVNRMVLFSINKENQIINYRIASTKEKILRSDCLKYEQYIGKIIEVK